MLLKPMTLEAKKVAMLLYKLLEKITPYHFLYPYFFQFLCNRLSQQKFKGYMSMIENGVVVLGKSVYYG
jgi:hypothetical protein